MPECIMTTDEMIQSLYNDISLTSALLPDQAEQLLSWAEGGIQECRSSAEFQRFRHQLRLMNRYVEQGGRFEHLFAMLRNGRLRERSSTFAPHSREYYYHSSFVLLY